MVSVTYMSQTTWLQPWPIINFILIFFFFVKNSTCITFQKKHSTYGFCTLDRDPTLWQSLCKSMPSHLVTNISCVVVELHPNDLGLRVAQMANVSIQDLYVHAYGHTSTGATTVRWALWTTTVKHWSSLSPPLLSLKTTAQAQLSCTTSTSSLNHNSIAQLQHHCATSAPLLSLNPVVNNLNTTAQPQHHYSTSTPLLNLSGWKWESIGFWGGGWRSARIPIGLSWSAWIPMIVLSTLHWVSPY